MDQECLEVQLNELDTLMSMFSCDSELTLDDPSVVADMRTSLGEVLRSKDGHRCEGQAGERSPRQHGQIGFTIKLQTENEHTIEMIFRLPLTYPKSAPDVSIRISVLSRHNHQLYNEKLQAFIRELRPEEPVIYEIIQWIKETSDSFIEEYNNSCSVTVKPPNIPSASMGTLEFSRLWIYSHHIYNKVKRKSIVDLANDLGLTGFSVPGKPGIICVEGNQRNSEDFWQKIRSMQWKKISLIHREDLTADDSTKFEELRAFHDFEEKHFDPRTGKGREVHMDLGLLFQFLQERGFSDIFQMYFGIKGRESEQDNC